MKYEDQISISTPEGLELQYTLAGLGSRFLASLVDFVIRLAILIALGLVLHFADVGDVAARITLSVVVFIELFVYDLVFEVWGGGRTPGKRWTGLRVLRAGGQPISFAASAVRNLLRLIDIYLTLTVAGTVSILVSKRDQRLGDMAGGTIVIRERSASDRGLSIESLTRGAAPAVAPSVPDRPGIDLTGITADDLALVRDFLARREQLTADARSRVADALAERTRPKTGGLDLPLDEPEKLLELIAAGKYRER